MREEGSIRNTKGYQVSLGDEMDLALISNHEFSPLLTDISGLVLCTYCDRRPVRVSFASTSNLRCTRVIGCMCQFRDTAVTSNSGRHDI